MDKRRKIRFLVISHLYQVDLGLEPSPYREEEALKIALGVLENLNQIDQIINDSLYNYELSRLPYLDKAIIRLATYEMAYLKIAKEIVINEAVEISKLYTDLDDAKQHKFNNSVLDNIAKKIEG